MRLWVLEGRGLSAGVRGGVRPGVGPLAGLPGDHGWSFDSTGRVSPGFNYLEGLSEAMIEAII